MIEQITARIVPPNFICCVGASLFFKRGHALGNQCVHGGEVSAVDFANLLALLEQDKTWTAGQRSVLEFVFDFFWNERLVGTEEFQTKEVFVVPQMQSSVVHLHVVAATAPRQVHVDTDQLFVLFADLLQKLVLALDGEEHLSQLLRGHLVVRFKLYSSFSCDLKMILHGVLGFWGFRV